MIVAFVIVFSSYGFGWYARGRVLDDDARKYGVLNINGMKFVRHWEDKEQVK